MGEIADMMIDGLLDEQTGEYIDGHAPGYPRTMHGKNNGVNMYEILKNETPSERKIRAVRKELAILIEKKKRENDTNPIQNARKEINLKYGKGWRERGLTNNPDNQWTEEELKPYLKFKNYNGKSNKTNPGKTKSGKTKINK